jgi:hypothetical protein
MNIYQNNTYSGETIELDNGAFRACTFEDCTLKFSGAGPTELNGCTFTGSRLAPAAAAQLTLTYLRGFYQGLGDWGRQTVEQMFDEIRGTSAQGTVAAHPGPTDLLTVDFKTTLERFGASPDGQAIVRGFERLSPAQRRQIADLIAGAAQRQAA